LQAVSPQILKEYKDRADEILIAQQKGACVGLTVTLKFDSNFLVNDPSQTGKALPDQEPLHHAPLRDIDNLVLLPPRSFRGAFRSHAEKILRTMGKKACYPDSKSDSCEPIYNKKKGITNLCPACQVFGAPGWRSPFQVTPFKPKSTEAELAGSKFSQEFLAIDRFKGGGAESAKFNAESVYRPVLEGQIKLDLTALKGTPAAAWAIGLLALTLRDLQEGDITFGFGASKGYGSCEATFSNFVAPPWGEIPQEIKDCIDEASLQSLVPNPSLTDELQLAVSVWIENLEAYQHID
jgi:CRISPR/Cas system CSM-associated protein Csm3 (group 7 of RAMP superfamily)